jgi:integrase
MAGAAGQAAAAPPAKGEDETVEAWLKRLTRAQKAELRAWRRAHRWHPHQLRHTYAIRVRKRFGLEEAQTLLGHTKADVTRIYAERDMGKAAMMAAKIG